MKLKTPESIINNHTHLLSEIREIIKNNKNIKKLAQPLEKLMAVHFRKEESYALSPLGVLLSLSEDRWQFDKDTIAEISKLINSNLAELKEEHKNIEEIMQTLQDITKKENHSDLKKFLGDLRLHIDLEDQVLYPATVLIINSILIGDYFKKPKHFNN